MTVPAPVLTAIQVAADPSAWAAAGFSVTGATLVVGGVAIDFVDGEKGIVDWELVGRGAAQR